MTDSPEYDGEIEPGVLKEPRTLAERVAVLEEMCAYPLRVLEAPELAAEQEAELREALGALGRDGKPFGYKILPPRPLLTPELTRELLRECVTVVKPGETLFIRVDRSWTPNQLREYTDTLQAWLDHREIDVRVVIGWGEGFAVAERPETAENAEAPR